MWCAAKERVCAWNPYNSKGASGSPRENSQTARASLPKIDLRKDVAPIDCLV